MRSPSRPSPEQLTTIIETAGAAWFAYLAASHPGTVARAGGSLIYGATAASELERFNATIKLADNLFELPPGILEQSQAAGAAAYGELTELARKRTRGGRSSE